MTARKRRNRRGSWTSSHIAVLKFGRDLFNPRFAWSGGVASRRRYPDSVLPADQIPAHHLEDMRAAWTELGPEIMRTWAKPGRRPWGWWLFDSPQPRDERPEFLQLLQMGRLPDAERETLREEAAHDEARGQQSPWHGLPFRRSDLWWIFATPEARDPNVLEVAQLTRMGRLTRWERDIMADPETAQKAGCRPCLSHLEPEERLLLGLEPLKQPNNVEAQP